MKVFPVMLNLHDRLAVVVGGGEVGARRAKALLEAGAKVRLVCPTAVRKKLPGIERIKREFQPSDLDSASIVLAATDDRAVNAAVAAEARRRGILVNVADTPESCDFYMPAVFVEGDVCVAVSTGGAAPALARQIRDDIAEMLEGMGRFAAALAEVRRMLREECPDPKLRMKIMKHLCGPQGQALGAIVGAPTLKLAVRYMMEHDGKAPGITDLPA